MRTIHSLRAVRRQLAPLFLLTLAAATPTLANAAGRAERPIDHPFGAKVRAVELENLAGSITVVAGNSGRVSGTVFAEDSAGKSGRDLAAALEVEFEQRGDRLVVKAIYPLDRHRKFHYPELREDIELEPDWLFSWFDIGGSHVKYQGRQVRVTSRPSSGTPTLWADFRLEIPAGVAVTVKNLVGHVRSTAVEGDQILDTASGSIDADGGRGSLVADTGSGDVHVTDHRGDVVADTGSGDIVLTDVRGNSLSADTGSGDVLFERCTGSINADTGSGNVIGRELVVGRRLRADTGSGDVRLAGDLSAVRDLVIDTGSGDVSLVLSGVPSVQLRVSTGSGDIEVDVDSMRVRRSRDEFLADLGAAEGEAVIDTGSGDVRVRQGR